jgi:hypothetical protein
MSTEPRFELSPAERAAIRRGDYSALVRDKDPGVKPGHTIVVLKTKATRTWDRELGRVLEHQPQPTLWITIKRVVRGKKGEWVVRFDVGRREPERYPAFVAGYTTDKTRAADDRAAVDDDDLERYAVKAQEDHARFNEQAKRERERQPITKRLEVVLAEAERSGVDVTRQVASIEQRVKATESKVRRLGKDPSERAA